MKMIKTRFRNHLSDANLDALMLVAIEGPDKLTNLDILHEWKHCKNQADTTACPFRRLNVLTKENILQNKAALHLD